MKKRAQTEIVGLAIVVILLVIGMTFVIRFTLNNEPTSVRQDFLREQLASNTINTFLQTTSRDCNDLTMTQLIQDCAQSNIIVCENSMSSCEYVEFTAQNIILADTLSSWNIPHEFMIYREETAPLIVIGTSCPADKKAKLWPIPLSSGTVFARLDICG